MSKGIIHSIGNVVELQTQQQRKIQNVSEEPPTLADLVLPGTGHKFSDEFACLLRMLGGERESA
jgi:hypothetical protein